MHRHDDVAMSDKNTSPALIQWQYYMQAVLLFHRVMWLGSVVVMVMDRSRALLPAA